MVANMKVEFQKWGNSLAVRVPSAFAREVGAAAGKRAELTIENGALVVRVPAAQSRKRRRYRLEDLVADITPENRHAAINWGPPVGNEVW
jgi:antitoxin MazE